MIGLVTTVVPFLVTLVIYSTYGAGDLFGAAIGLTCVCALVNIIIHGCCIYEQIDDIETIAQYKGQKVIYAKKRDELITQATLYLGEKYPEHEKELFKMISEKNNAAVVNILAALPEIKSADTLKSLVETITKEHGNVYYQDIQIETLKKKIRIRSRNPWLLQSIIPKYVDEEV